MAHIEQTRAVVEAEETFDGKIIPTSKAELGRPVRVREGGTVQGSVYGETVETATESAIEGSVMASEAVELTGGRIHGEVGTPGKVVGEDTRIEGTVTGKRVTLRDCVVRGNVVGTDVILEDCTVLGIVTADRKLELSESLCYSFRSQGKTVLDEVTLILPQAIADGDVRFESSVSVVGLGSLDVDTEDDDETNRLPQMTEADLYEQDGRQYLTLSARILNIEKINDRLNELEEGVLAAVDDTTDDEPGMNVSDVLGLLNVDSEEANVTG